MEADNKKPGKLRPKKLNLGSNHQQQVCLHEEELRTSDSEEEQCAELDAGDFEDCPVSLLNTCGVVYKMLYKPRNIHFAVKKVFVTTEQERKTIVQEARALADCKHENVVRCIGTFSEDQNVFVALEYMDLGSLADMFNTLNVLNEQILAAVAFQILSGLDYLHRCKKVVHREVRPSNILFDSKGNVKLGDFISVDDSRKALNRKQLMEALYMSPERLRGSEYASNSDIWSVGISVLESAVGHHPFKKEGFEINYWVIQEAIQHSVPEPPETLSIDFKDFIKKCLTRNSLERPSALTLLSHPFVTAWKTSSKDKLAVFFKMQAAAVQKSKHESRH